MIAALRAVPVGAAAFFAGAARPAVVAGAVAAFGLAFVLLRRAYRRR